MTVYIILLSTIACSLLCFSNKEFYHKLCFSPYRIVHHKEWYRMLTYGFIHADLAHLAFNMISLYFFYEGLMIFFETYFSSPPLFFIVFYVITMVFSIIPQLILNYNNSRYLGVGASGAVVAVVFAVIILFPNSKIGLFFFPPIIPAYIFAFVYLGISWYLFKKQKGNIDHLTHFCGALIGIAILWALCLQVDYPLWQNFIYKILY